jgi:sporulation protein YlmC with PRC-barrel domain
MLRPTLTMLCVITILGVSGTSDAQVAGTTTIGVTVTEMNEIIAGWSAKKNMLGKPVYNDANQKIGSIDDIIITPEKSVSYAIVGTGGFVGLMKHDVAIPMSHLQLDKGKVVLPGATKEVLKALPEFAYAK